MGKVKSSPRSIARAKPLVVAVDQFSTIVDNVDTVVWLAAAGETVAETQEHPDPQAARKFRDLATALIELVPIEAVVGKEIGSGVPRKCSLAKMHDVGATILRRSHLTQDVPGVPPNVRSDGKLAGRNFEHGPAEGNTTHADAWDGSTPGALARW